MATDGQILHGPSSKEQLSVLLSLHACQVNRLSVFGLQSAATKTLAAKKLNRSIILGLNTHPKVFFDVIAPELWNAAIDNFPFEGKEIGTCDIIDLYNF